MTLLDYINTINNRFKSGISREHSYRADLENLIRELVKGVDITNEPANVTDCGNPDYVVTKGKIPIGYIEAKDIGKDLNNKNYKEQFTRYRKALDNLIITDYIRFQFFQYGELVYEIKIGEIDDKRVKPITENFEEFENLIRNFCSFIGQTIKSSKKLAEMMASKARLLQNILERAVTTDEERQENTSLKGQYEIFKKVLIHDLKPNEFADIYAQTLAYGMFAARLHDKTLENFSRQEAAELIPKTNPFLRKLFQYVAGYDIDERIRGTVDNLAEVFRATNVEELLKNFGDTSSLNDPIIHFYETFLAEYDPSLRKSRGVWYTPEPIVNFIVRAACDVLKTEFGLSQGLADTSKTKIKVPEQGTHKAIEKEVHRVQILDPATGTGTFLAEVVKYIYNKNFKAMQGAWSGYVEEHLIPRLNGFELLMASYAMAHLKLDMLLTETGYKPQNVQRFHIYLTNSLEEYHEDTGQLFAQFLSSEANEANHIKRDTPVMVVIGNPPYSVSSSNKSEWIEKLMEDYKKNLNEKNINPLSDDYLKFIRYGQFLIDRNKEGILAFISNNSFLDGIIHKQMRKELLLTFDKIYIIDLHGNSKKREISPDGSKDENVFDIMQGVSINIFIKTNKKNTKDFGKVFHYDLYGSREYKYNSLMNNNINSIQFSNLKSIEPNYFYVQKNFELQGEYDKGFNIHSIFNYSTSGIKTHDDKNLVSFSKFDNKHNHTYHYKPFDYRYINYDLSLVVRHRFSVLKHVFNKLNYGLVLMRKLVNTNDYTTVMLTKTLLDINFYGFQTYYFPLYLYPEENNLDSEKKIPNLNQEIANQISDILQIPFISEPNTQDPTPNTQSFSPIDILDYIYAVLHSPSYREKYKEFLKIDFPRVPYPKDLETFWQLVKLGGELREIHLLESPNVTEFITNYPVDGNHLLEKIHFDSAQCPADFGKVYINKEQYFEGVPNVAWEFYIGGYQPAQKWLKDRKGRSLNFEDILHYQKIIIALTETDRIMKEIDQIEIES